MPYLYKLQNDAKPGELGGPPFILGSALRFPSYAYPTWGIHGTEKELFPLSTMAYREEFFDTSPAWMESVIESVTRAGLGNRSQMIREGAGEVAAKLTHEMLKKQRYVNVLDVGCGAGGSLVAYLDALKTLDPSYLERVNLTGVDLSRQSMLKAIDTLEERGFKSGKNFRPVDSRDIDMPAHIINASEDIVINVAGIHANAYLEPAIWAISYTLKAGGYFVSGDWHHARWEHPYHTYKLLDEMDAEHLDWKNRGEFMDEFLAMFSLAKEKPDLSSMDPADLRAIEEIGKYWNGWTEVRLEKIRSGKLKPQDEQIVAEGHRPVEHYIEDGRRCNLVNDNNVLADGIMRSNPQQVVEGTNLNMLLVLRKKI